MPLPFTLFQTNHRPNIRLSPVPPSPDPEHSGLHDHPDGAHAENLPGTPLVLASSDPANTDDLSAHAADRLSDRELLYPTSYGPSPHGGPPGYSTYSEHGTPLPSRSPSPLPSYVSPSVAYSSGASSYSSDDESDPDAPFLSGHGSMRRSRPSSWREEHRRQWSILDAVRRRKRRESLSGLRTVRRGLRIVIRHPFFPKTPVTILLSLAFFAAFAVSLTFLIIYILNPDKDPLPWRGYCTIPPQNSFPPDINLPTSASFPYTPAENFSLPVFPPPGLDDLSPAGLFLGVFSVDNGVERRMLIRSTWASHQRSREGVGAGDGGVGTSRTVVRFILGQPTKEWERRIKLETELYNDIIVLPVAENMNSGKSHTYFSWAASNAWVPPLYEEFPLYPQQLSYENDTAAAPVPAEHDSVLVRRDYQTGTPKPWVRPDYVAKVDDDAFVMLAELEARLRVELHRRVAPQTPPSPPPPASTISPLPPLNATQPRDLAYNDPLVFWGYLVKNRFMAGELYAISYSIVHWIATDPQLRSMTRGAEDKQTSKWMRLHPRADEVRWVSERCWIYDHPRASTVYSHGFLFPSEVSRVQRVVLDDISRWRASTPSSPTSSTEVPRQEQVLSPSPGASAPYIPSPFGANGVPPATWAYSSVSKFGARYAAPVPDLTLAQSVEALVEGSEMSLLHEGGARTPWHAWKDREGHSTRYRGARVGGTVVVHFIKKNMWFLETAYAFLHGEDVTEAERAAGMLSGGPPAPASATSVAAQSIAQPTSESAATSVNTSAVETETGAKHAHWTR